MSVKQKKALVIAGLCAFAVLMALAGWFVGRPMIKFAREPELFREWVQGHGLRGQLAFTGMMILQTVVAIIPGEPFEIVAGYAFGTALGTFLCLLGELIGSVCVFLFVRRFGVKAVEVFFSREKIDSLKFLKNEKKLGAFTFFVFLTPGTPKDILCYCVGLTRMKLSTWLLISSLGRFPSVITSTIGGDALGLGNRLFAVITFAVTFALSAAGLLIYNQIVKRRAKDEAREARLEKQLLRREKRARKRAARAQKLARLKKRKSRA